MGSPLQGVDIPVAIAWATEILGRQGVCDALSVNETTLAGLSTGTLEADGDLRMNLLALLDSVESVGLGRPPATQTAQQESDGRIPGAAPAPGVAHEDIAEPQPPSTQRSPVPASYEEVYKQRSVLYKLLLLRKELRRDRETISLTFWQDISVELAILKVESALIYVFGDLIPVEKSHSQGMEDGKERRLRRIREIEAL